MKTTSLPRVKFKLPTTSKEAEILTMFCQSHKGVWDWSAVIYKNHPDLKEILKDKKSREFYSHILKYARACVKERKGELEKLVTRYQREWNKINDPYLEILSSHLETEYPRSRKIITAYVSIVPIYPRFLDEWAFNVSSKKPEMVVPISMHEILHFLYFKKWMETFPKTKRKELDAPHLVWRLSEILDPIMLNNNPEIQALLKHKHGHYSEFQNVKIGNKTLIKHFEDLYKKHLKSRQPFGDFLKICWNEALKHREIIEDI